MVLAAGGAPLFTPSSKQQYSLTVLQAPLLFRSVPQAVLREALQEIAPTPLHRPGPQPQSHCQAQATAAQRWQRQS